MPLLIQKAAIDTKGCVRYNFASLYFMSKKGHL